MKSIAEIDTPVVIVSPWGKQSDAIESVAAELDHELLVVFDELTDMAPLRRVTNVRLITETEFHEHASELLDRLWFPFTQVGTYCILRTGLSESAKLPFARSAMMGTTKSLADRLLADHGLPTIDRVVPPECDYPIVGKPNFGFASRFVRICHTPGEVAELRRQISEQYTSSMLGSYHSRYFRNGDLAPDPSALVFEKDLSHREFYSVSFVVSRSGEISIYPVRGIGRHKNETSDFMWREGVVTRISRDLDEMLKTLAKRLTRVFGISFGVYGCEVLVDPILGDVSILEFESRPMGGWINDLIDVAYGIDLDQIALRLALGQSPSTLVGLCREVYGRRTEEGAPEEPVLEKACPIRRIARLSERYQLVDVVYDLEDVRTAIPELKEG